MLNVVFLKNINHNPTNHKVDFLRNKVGEMRGALNRINKGVDSAGNSISKGIDKYNEVTGKIEDGIKKIF